MIIGGEGTRSMPCNSHSPFLTSQPSISGLLKNCSHLQSNSEGLPVFGRIPERNPRRHGVAKAERKPKRKILGTNRDIFEKEKTI